MAQDLSGYQGDVGRLANDDWQYIRESGETKLN